MIRIKNYISKHRAMFIGEGFPYRLNALIGMSGEGDYQNLIASAEAYEKAGADCIQDVSICGDIRSFKRELSACLSIPCGTVAIYEYFRTLEKKPSINSKDIKNILLEQVVRDCEAGYDFITFHSCLNRKMLKLAGEVKIGSRGGIFAKKVMLNSGLENPLYSYFEDVVEVLSEFGVTVALGSVFRSCTHFDYGRSIYEKELSVQKELYEIAQRKGVNVFLEGISHIKRNEMPKHRSKINELLPKAEVTCLGPLMTDIAMGLDHICGAMGSIEAARNGFVLSSIVTAKEHYSLPEKKDVLEAIKAYRVSKYLISLEKGLSPYRDELMSNARFNLDWDSTTEMSMFNVAACNENEAGCSICGKDCPIENSQDIKKGIGINVFFDQIDNVCSPYSIEIQNVLLEAIKAISIFDIKALYVFGSLVTGDFVITDEGQYASDIELIAISDRDSENLIEEIRIINDNISFDHFGFNINIGVMDENTLRDRMCKSSIFNNTLIKQSVLCIGDEDIIAKFGLELQHHTRDECLLYLSNVIDEVLINLDSRVYNTNNDYCGYKSHIVKLIVKYCAFVNLYNGNEFSSYSDYLHSSHDYFSPTLYNEIRKSYFSLYNNGLLNGFDPACCLSEVANHFAELDGDELIMKKFIMILGRYENLITGSLITDRFDEAVIRVLKDKKEHYQYYKDCYGVL